MLKIINKERMIEMKKEKILPCGHTRIACRFVRFPKAGYF